ncbi:MAG: DUF4926 domain-containing protein [Bacteroidetes bacterium]|nr:MAG: DUF4926 domain-containing protein [Bacteroidota bacterium]
MKTDPLKLCSTVALLKDFLDKKVVFGQVGTVVEILSENVFEVEFANKFGETIAEFAVEAKYLMLLHYEMEIANG